jgi:inner membrane protein
MLVFGHTVVTMGAALLLNRALTKSQTHRRVNESRGKPRPRPGIPSQNWSSDGIVSWFTSLANRIDIRLLLVGSLLPDIIDKPVGVFLFRDTFSNGRIFCHTLLFLILITLGGLYLYRSRNKTWLLVLSFGTFTHLILDRMWLTPRTLLWPLYGFSFERIDLSHWLQDMLYVLLNYPALGIVELVGAVAVIWFLWLLVRRGNLYAFIRNGQV